MKILLSLFIFLFLSVSISSAEEVDAEAASEKIMKDEKIPNPNRKIGLAKGLRNITDGTRSVNKGSVVNQFVRINKKGDAITTPVAAPDTTGKDRTSEDTDQ